MEELNFDQAAEERRQLDSIASRFDNPKSFPDLIIICHGRRWFCHRMILCMRSTYFEKMCRARFKEAGALEVELPRAEPCVLEAALKYCYTLTAQPHELPPGSELDTGLFYGKLYHLAEDHKIKGLVSLAADGFTEAINSEDSMDIQRLGKAFHEAYSRPDPMGRLRKAIMEKMLSNAAAFLGGDVLLINALVRDVPDFASDAIKALANAVPKELPRDTTYDCPSGGCHHPLAHEHADIEENGDITFYCPRLRITWTKSPLAWLEFVVD